MQDDTKEIKMMTTAEDRKTDTFDFILNRAKESYSGLSISPAGAAIQSGDLSREARKEWKEHCERLKKNENPIERYCYDIRGIKAMYEYGFEEYLHLQAENESQAFNEIDKHLELERFGYRRTKPEAMTNKQWQDLKRQKK
jgi:hypothetical protein